MPHIMMSAEVGFIPHVTGISSAIPAEGPIPGSTPMIVPRKTPMNVYQRLIGCRQTAKPFRMWVSVSTACSSERQDSRRERHAENLREHDVGADGKENRGRHVGNRLAAIEVARE